MSDTQKTAAPQGLGFAEWQAQVVRLIQRFGVSREAAMLMVDPDKPDVMKAYKAAVDVDSAAADIAGIEAVPAPKVPATPAAVTPPAPPIDPLNEGKVQPSDPKPPVESSDTATQGGFGAWVAQVTTQIKRYGVAVVEAQAMVKENLAELERAFGRSEEPEAAAQELVDASAKQARLDDAGFLVGYPDWQAQAIAEVMRQGISRMDADAEMAANDAKARAAYIARTDPPTFALTLINQRNAIPNQEAHQTGLQRVEPIAATKPPAGVPVPMPAAPVTPPADLRGGYGDWTFEVIRQLRRFGMSPMDAQGMVAKHMPILRTYFEGGIEPEVTAKGLVGDKPLQALDDAESERLKGGAKADTKGPVNVFKEGDKVISLDGNKDLTVTHQEGYKVYCKGVPQWIHANRLKLASGKAPNRVVMDDAGEDEHKKPRLAGGYPEDFYPSGNGGSTASMTSGSSTGSDATMDAADDFDPEAEFDACEPWTDEEEAAA